MKKNNRIIEIFLILFICCLSYYSLIAEKKHPVLFSHKKHIEDIGADCVDCHSTVKESQKSEDKNLPTHKECFNCHNDNIASQKCNVCHTDPDNPESLENPIRDFYFNHKFHIDEQGQTCSDCHKGLEKVDYAKPENLPNMAYCFQCHNDIKASKRCDGCHTPTAKLIPQTHNADWLMAHRNLAKIKETECMTCHNENYCQECHTGSKLLEVGNTDKDYINPSAPSIEGKNKMVIQRVHELNYRYNHGIDVNSKRMNCYTCHDESQFCVRCHLNDEKIQILKPSWHSGKDWGAIVEAVGSGGGRHAQLARRDIEKCAGCHDTQGEDPVCLMCHRDFIPGKGNDLKTHSTGMFKGAGEGIWHVDDGAICFNCHTNSKIAGTGFCGYCHGIK